MYIYSIKINQIKKSDLDKLIIFIFMFCLGFNTGLAQEEEVSYDFTYEVNRVYKPLAISTQTLDTAISVADLNPHFKPSWVKEYKSVEISTLHNKKVKTVSTADDLLSLEQISNMKNIDLGSEISVSVKYIPDNNLRHNDIQEEKFHFTVDPVKEATFSGGEQKLNQYIQDKIIAKISQSDVQVHNVKAIQFSIDQSGDVVGVHIPENLTMYNLRSNKKVEDFLLKVICDMPSWSPAEYNDGTKVNQDFVLTVGDHRSCTLNLLNIRREGQ